MKKIVRYFSLFVINHFLCGTHFWSIKRFLLKISDILVGNNVKIVGPIYMKSCSDLEIGDNTWIGEKLVIAGNDKVVIGKNCDISSNVTFATGTHYISSSKRRAGQGYCKRIIIGDGCWIGINSTILSGVKIDSGVIVGACSCVNKSIDENILVGGIPAKKIRDLDE